MTLIYGYFALDDELKNDWEGHKSVEDALTDISAFVPFCTAFVAVIIGLIDICLSIGGTSQENNKIENAKAEGIAQGLTLRTTEAEANALKMIVEWYHRKLEKEARGEPFTEKPPRIE